MPGQQGRCEHYYTQKAVIKDHFKNVVFWSCKEDTFTAFNMDCLEFYFYKLKKKKKHASRQNVA